MHQVGDKMMSEWTKWFAWYPIKIHGEWHWFSIVYCRGGYSLTDQYGYDYTEFGTILDVLKEEQNGY